MPVPAPAKVRSYFFWRIPVQLAAGVPLARGDCCLLSLAPSVSADRSPLASARGLPDTRTPACTHALTQTLLPAAGATCWASSTLSDMENLRRIVELPDSRMAGEAAAILLQRRPDAR